MGSINLPAKAFLDEKQPTDRPRGSLVRDRDVYNVLNAIARRWHHERIYTELPEELMAAGVAHSTNRQLYNILKDAATVEDGKMMKHLLGLRNMINLYFNVQGLRRVPFIEKRPTMPANLAEIEKRGQEYMQRITYLSSDASSPAMHQAITTISLFLQHLIHFYRLNNGQIYHHPSQVKFVIDQYEKRTYIVDAYYKYYEDSRIVINLQESL